MLTLEEINVFETIARKLTKNEYLFSNILLSHDIEAHDLQIIAQMLRNEYNALHNENYMCAFIRDNLHK